MIPLADKWLTVGKLVNTHGIRGEVKVLPSTDFPEERFAEGSRLTLHAPDGVSTVPVEIVSAREHKGMYICRLKGFDNINDVEKYKGWAVKVPSTDRVKLEDGEYYYDEIIGCRVVTEDGEALGVISEILRPGANDVWVADRPNGKQLLLPVIDEVVLNVDTSAKLITIHLMEGLE